MSYLRKIHNNLSWTTIIALYLFMLSILLLIGILSDNINMLVLLFLFFIPIGIVLTLFIDRKRHKSIVNTNYHLADIIRTATKNLRQSAGYIANYDSAISNQISFIEEGTKSSLAIAVGRLLFLANKAVSETADYTKWGNKANEILYDNANIIASALETEDITLACDALGELLSFALTNYDTKNVSNNYSIEHFVDDGYRIATLVSNGHLLFTESKILEMRYKLASLVRSPKLKWQALISYWMEYYCRWLSRNLQVPRLISIERQYEQIVANDFMNVIAAFERNDFAALSEVITISYETRQRLTANRS